MNYHPTHIGEYFQQGKSNNFIVAQQNGHATLGQAAKILSKKFGMKILAKQLEGLASEWHHAGSFRGRGRKVYFLTPTQIEGFTSEDVNRLAQNTQTATPSLGWITKFQTDYTGRYGRKRCYPIIGRVGEFTPQEVVRAGDKFHPLSPTELELCKRREGCQLPPYCDDFTQAF